jgi:hypothetical protein
LGDVVDDYCSRCRLLMNHGVVGMVGDEIKKVRCLTCQGEHTYRHGKAARRKKDGVEALFEQVLRGMPGPAPPAASTPARPGKPPAEGGKDKEGAERKDAGEESE